MTIFNFVFKRFFRVKSNVLVILILPIAIVFLPVGEWLPIPLGYQYYGILLLLISARLGGIIMEDRENKVLLRLGVAPVSHFQYLWQNLLAYSVILTGINSVFLIVGVIYHGEQVISPMLLFIIYSVFSMTAISFSLAWYSLFRHKETAFHTLSVLIILIAMLGGMMWPIELMPNNIQKMAMFLPTYWFAEGMQVISFSEPLAELVLPLVMMFMFAVAYIILGSRRRIV